MMPVLLALTWLTGGLGVPPSWCFAIWWASLFLPSPYISWRYGFQSCLLGPRRPRPFNGQNHAAPCTADLCHSSIFKALIRLTVDFCLLIMLWLPGTRTFRVPWLSLRPFSHLGFLEVPLAPQWPPCCTYPARLWPLSAPCGHAVILSVPCTALSCAANLISAFLLPSCSGEKTSFLLPFSSRF